MQLIYHIRVYNCIHVPLLSASHLGIKQEPISKPTLLAYPSPLSSTAEKVTNAPFFLSFFSKCLFPFHAILTILCSPHQDPQRMGLHCLRNGCVWLNVFESTVTELGPCQALRRMLTSAYCVHAKDHKCTDWVFCFVLANAKTSSWLQGGDTCTYTLYILRFMHVIYERDAFFVWPPLRSVLHNQPTRSEFFNQIKNWLMGKS